MHEQGRHAAGRVRALLQDASGLDETPDKFVGFFIADFGLLELLGRVSLEQLVIGVVGHRADRRGEIGIGFVQDLILSFSKASGARRKGTQPFGNGRSPRDVVLHHRADHRVEIFGLVISAGELLIDHPSQPILGEPAPGGGIRDGAVADRPDVLDGVNARVDGADDVPTVGGDRHVQPMGFVDGDFHEIHGKKLIDLEDVAAEFLFPPHRSAHFFGRCDDDVVAGCARAEGIVPGADAADRPARHPNPRPANFTQIGALFLR